MINAVYSALSALGAFGKKMEVTAHNVANINTDGFKKSRVILQETSPSGVTVSINRIDQPGSPLPCEEVRGEAGETSNVAIEEEMVDLIITQHAYTVNLKKINVEEEILGKIFDVLDK